MTIVNARKGGRYALEWRDDTCGQQGRVMQMGDEARRAGKPERPPTTRSEQSAMERRDLEQLAGG